MKKLLLLFALVACKDADTAWRYARVAYPGVECTEINTNVVVCRQGTKIYRCKVTEGEPWCEYVRTIELETEDPCKARK